MTNELKELILREVDRPQPSSRVIDIDRAMREGRGIDRRTVIAVVVAGGAVLSVAGGGAMIAREVSEPAGSGSRGSDPTERATSDVCRIRELAIPEGATDSSVIAGEPSGRFLAGSAWGDGTSGLLVLWENGQPTTFSVPGATRANVAAVNNFGIVVGSSDAGPWRYADGKATLLSTSAGRSSFATNINSRGDVVGYRSDGTGRERAIIWPAHEPGVVRDLVDRSLERNHSYENTIAAGIGDDGTIVGFADLGSTESNAGDRFQVVVWRADGQLYELTRKGRGSTGHVSIRGELVLESSQRDGSNPILWRWLSNQYAYEVLPVQMQARSFNRNMVVVGTRRHSENRTSAVILREWGVLSELGLPNGVLSSAAVAVSDNGYVFGNVRFQNGRGAAVSWSGC
jgi:uncharacterized membrane protein